MVPSPRVAERSFSSQGRLALGRKEFSGSLICTRIDILFSLEAGSSLRARSVQRVVFELNRLHTSRTKVFAAIGRNFPFRLQGQRLRMTGRNYFWDRCRDFVHGILLWAFFRI